MKFTKLHGLGNDYVCVNCLEEDVCEPEKLARKMCHRHFGVGADGVILVKTSSKADFYMEMYNSDGSKGAMCGNGIRCLAKFVYDSGLTKGKKDILVETDAGLRRLYLHTENNKVKEVTVDMGSPLFCTDAGNISLQNYIRNRKRNQAYRNYTGCSDDTPVCSFETEGKVQKTDNNYDNEGEINNESIIKMLKIDGRLFKVVNVSVGNPHAVVICNDLKTLDVRHWGALIERHESYPDRTNVEFVCIKDMNNIEVKVWERGVGETLACGTGACASCAAAMAFARVGSLVKVQLSGGELHIKYNSNNGHLIMRGAVEEVYKGEM